MQGEKPAGAAESLRVARRQFLAKIKMINGLVYRGYVHFRPTVNRVKDELNEYNEKFIALTDVSDLKGRKIPYPALIAFQHIAYIAVDDAELNEQQKKADQNRPDSPMLQKRKISAYIDLPDGSRIRGTIFIRSFLKRAKDELNVKNDGKFIAVVEVVEPNSPADDVRLTYFVNSDQVVSIFPINDRIE